MKTLSDIELNQLIPDKSIEPKRKIRWRPETYTEANVTEDRTFDADAINIAELADIVGTLLADLRKIGIIE